MFSTRSVTQRVRMPPRYVGDREIDRALIPILRGRVLPDGAMVYAVEKANTRRFAACEPHGSSLLDYTVDVIVHAFNASAGTVVQLVDVRPGADDSLVGSALALKVTVQGFGPMCRHGTSVKGGAVGSSATRGACAGRGVARSRARHGARSAVLCGGSRG